MLAILMIMVFLVRYEVAPSRSGPGAVLLTVALAVLDVHERLDLGAAVGARELHGDGLGAARDAALVPFARAAVLQAVLVDTLAVPMHYRLASRFPCALAALHTLEA